MLLDLSEGFDSPWRSEGTIERHRAIFSLVLQAGSFFHWLGLRTIRHNEDAGKWGWLVSE